MNQEQSPYWFHAKRYGYGWGLPARREGWIVFISWLVLMLGVSPFLAPYSLPLFLVFIGVMTAGLIAICYIKGEPAKWRWGDEKKGS